MRESINDHHNTRLTTCGSIANVQHDGAADEAVDRLGASADTDTTGRCSTQDTDVSTTSTDPSEQSVNWTPRAHCGWEASCVAMARCDFCQKAGRRVIQRCSICKLSICKGCCEDGCLDDDKNHRLDKKSVQWEPMVQQKPSKLKYARQGNPRATRGRVTKDQGTSTTRRRARRALEAALAKETNAADHCNMRSSEKASPSLIHHHNKSRGFQGRHASPPSQAVALSPIEAPQWQHESSRHSYRPANQELCEWKGQWEGQRQQPIAGEQHGTSADWNDAPVKGYAALSSRFEQPHQSLPKLAPLSHHAKAGDSVVLPSTRHLLQIGSPSPLLVAPVTLPPLEHALPFRTSQRHMGGRDAQHAARERRVPSHPTSSSSPYATTPSSNRERPAVSPFQDEWPPNHQLQDLAVILMNNAVAMRRHHPKGPPLDHCLRDEISREWSTGLLRTTVPDEGRAYRFLLGATYIASVTLELDMEKNVAREWLCDQEKVLCKRGPPPIQHLPTRAFLHTG